MADRLQVRGGDLLFAYGLFEVLLVFGTGANLVEVQEAVVLRQVVMNDVCGGGARGHHDGFVVADHEQGDEDQERGVHRPEQGGVLWIRGKGYAAEEARHEEDVVADEFEYDDQPHRRQNRRPLKTHINIKINNNELKKYK
jgi:hypothetical protein